MPPLYSESDSIKTLNEMKKFTNSIKLINQLILNMLPAYYTKKINTKLIIKY